MRVLELKGEMHELITLVKDESAAEKLLKIIRDFVQKEKDSGADFEDLMTPEQVAGLRRAIARSADKNNFIPIQEAEKRLNRWLKQ